MLLAMTLTFLFLTLHQQCFVCSALKLCAAATAAAAAAAAATAIVNSPSELADM